MEEKFDFIAPEKLKDILLSKTAVDTGQSKDIVEKVISFQFRDALKMLREVKEVELTGLGKFMMSNRKVSKKISLIENIVGNLETGLAKGMSADGGLLGPEEMISWKMKLDNSNELLAYLKSKL
jgi:hypothetical protein